ncbi:glycosyltransferase family 9 protein [Spongiactinospora rosea]|uniref:Glycosyltransferase family 9 protein n=1 Tax=Spongiactinospora rosea TaxID=2248750 RepID=A0A366LUQ3_9ACTN|nr:glycosyltransferase family 9 protein [Spongiactinospora rosea]RBQ17273.1 glycosyltransferase family 9 protein [Spongiactinospora rosea]
MRLVGEHPHAPGPGGLPGPRALVLAGPGLGGLLSAVPALRALRGSGQQVLLAAPARLREAAELTGAVDRLVPIVPGRPIPWYASYGEPPDLTVNLRDADPASRRRLLALRPADLWAYEPGGAARPRRDGPHWDGGEDEVRRWCRLLGWYGLAADPANTALPVPLCPNPAKGAVVVHPGHAGAQWPEHRFALVADVLSGVGWPVVLTGDRSERALAMRVAAQGFLPPGAVLAGRTSPRRLCALVAGARLVVSGHPGLSRLAAAYGTPCLTVRGPDTGVDEVLSAALDRLARYDQNRMGYGVSAPAEQRRGT